MKTPALLPITDQVIRLLCAAILLQTLYFKFGAEPESVYIFETVGLGTAGRIGTGLLELLASIALFVPSLRFWGASLAFGLMVGAIFSHLTVLGINVLGDGGKLFALALTVCLGSLYLMFRYYQASTAEKIIGQLLVRKKTA
jgi:putative oxidoreductase